jgi:hypothetical protein
LLLCCPPRTASASTDQQAAMKTAMMNTHDATTRNAMTHPSDDPLDWAR